MLRQAIGARRDPGRLHDIAAVLIRYGFGDQVCRIGLAGARWRNRGGPLPPASICSRSNGSPNSPCLGSPGSTSRRRAAVIEK